jgi:threonine dehydrogenase-like Zn-dependent dehydrogenase
LTWIILRFILDERPVPTIGPGDAPVKITATTICGTDVHILKGEYPVEPGRINGHEPVGVSAELGLGVKGYEIGQRVDGINCCASRLSFSTF